jgi:hypothetical protein
MSLNTRTNAYSPAPGTYAPVTGLNIPAPSHTMFPSIATETTGCSCYKSNKIGTFGANEIGTFGVLGSNLRVYDPLSARYGRLVGGGPQFYW